jgi:putative RecB family exonuclease
MSSSSASAPVSLSPSRANDFKSCPLKYRYRTIDKLPEPTSAAQVKGTLVHAVLERLYHLAAAERTRPRAVELVEPEWKRLKDSDADAAAAVQGIESDWLADARTLVETYFETEDPQRLQPAERECLVEAVTDDGVRLKGYIDRLDVAPGGEIRVVDYKTGGLPREAFRAEAAFQLKFYALALWRTRGVIPRVLRLIYLKDGQVVDYSPTEQELRATERAVDALWRTIGQAVTRGDFRPKRSGLCGWCHFKDRCPEFGGTPPPYPLPITVLFAAPPDAQHPDRGEAELGHHVEVFDGFVAEDGLAGVALAGHGQGAGPAGGRVGAQREHIGYADAASAEVEDGPADQLVAAVAADDGHRGVVEEFGDEQRVGGVLVVVGPQAFPLGQRLGVIDDAPSFVGGGRRSRGVAGTVDPLCVEELEEAVGCQVQQVEAVLDRAARRVVHSRQHVLDRGAVVQRDGVGVEPRGAARAGPGVLAELAGQAVGGAHRLAPGGVVGGGAGDEFGRHGHIVPHRGSGLTRVSRRTPRRSGSAS